MTKDNMVRFAECASLVTSIVDDLKKHHPLSHDLVQESLVNLYLAGDVNLDVELQTAIHEKNMNFTMENITVVRELVTMCKTEVDSMTPEATTVSQSCRTGAA